MGFLPFPASGREEFVSVKRGQIVKINGEEYSLICQHHQASYLVYDVGEKNLEKLIWQRGMEIESIKKKYITKKDILRIQKLLQQRLEDLEQQREPDQMKIFHYQRLIKSFDNEKEFKFSTELVKEV